MVYLLSLHVLQLEAFKKEIAGFPAETREDLLSLIDRFLKGERLNRRDFKTFKIDKATKIQEFKGKVSLEHAYRFT